MTPGSVAVVTVASFDPDNGNPLPMGVAVSSLTSVTLDPPTISFNIKEPSQTLDAIHATGGIFTVHFLKADRKGAQIVDLFSRGNHAEAYKLRTNNLKIAMPGKLAGQYSFPPQILDRAVVAVMNCTVKHALRVADHVILAAQVDNGQHIRGMRTLLAYADGEYRNATYKLTPDSSPSEVDSSYANEISKTKSGWSVWNMPLIPGENDRQEYVNHFKSIVKQLPEGLEWTQIERGLRKMAGYPAHLVGIDWPALMDDCIRDAGQPNGPATPSTYVPPLMRYYGRLSTSQRQSLVTEVVEAVRDDPDLQFLPYPDFLRHFGVNLSVRGLLPSDIMLSLREAGLDKSYKLSQEGLQRVLLTTTDCTLSMAEQVEVLLRKHIGALPFEQAVEDRTKYGFGLTIIEQSKNLNAYFSGSASRLVAECHPSHFGEENIDIKGDLTLFEANVVLARIIRFLRAEGIYTFKKRLHMSPFKILYLNRIHPCVTGLQIELLLQKILHIYNTTGFNVELKYFETKLMLDPYLKHWIGWSTLRRRIERFIKFPPANASKWTKVDKLAAVGVHWEAKIGLSDDRGHLKDIPVMEVEEIDALFAATSAKPPKEVFETPREFTTSDATVHSWLEEQESPKAITHDEGEIEDDTKREIEYEREREVEPDEVENEPKREMEDEPEREVEDETGREVEDEPKRKVENEPEWKYEDKTKREVENATERDVEDATGQEVADKTEREVEDKSEPTTANLLEESMEDELKEEHEDELEQESEDWVHTASATIEQIVAAQEESGKNKETEPTNWLTFSLLNRKKN